NHYHPNIWRTGGEDTVSPGGDHVLPMVGTQGTPEPMNEPMREPPIRRISEELKLVGEEERKTKKDRESPYPLAKPQYRLDGIGPRRLVPTSEVMEFWGLFRAPRRVSRHGDWVTAPNPSGE